MAQMLFARQFWTPAHGAREYVLILLGNIMMIGAEI